MNGMNGLGKVLSPGMPMGMSPGMPQGIPPGMNQGIPPSMPQGMQQGMPQVGQPGHPNIRNEEEYNKESECINNFLNIINEVPLPISDKVINNICAQSGFSTSDPRLARLLSLASEYLIIIAVNECKKITGDRTDLQLADVKKAVERLNTNVYRPEYIVNPIDSESAGIDDNQIFDLSSNMDDNQMFE